MSVAWLVVPVVAGVAVYGLHRLCSLLYVELTAPIRSLPGPKATSWFFGNLREIFDLDQSTDEWLALYGPTFRFNGLLMSSRLYTIDPKAQNHVIMNNDIYQRPLPIKRSLARVVGPGVLVTEGDVHKKQRKVMNPAFGPAQIRDLTGIFIEKSMELRDLWTAEAAIQGGIGHVDVLSWLSRMTLDVIGLAGFNYRFNALSGDQPSELSQAFSTIFHSGNRGPLIFLVRSIFPPLDLVKTSRDRLIESAQIAMRRIGCELLSASKAAVSQSEKEMGDRSLRSHNLLSVLVRANTSSAIPHSSRLSDEDVLAQIPTFLVAGHETTSTATTWALFALSQEPAVQAKLRDELRTVQTETPTMDELNSLPYLDRVVRETLRVYPPVPAVGRVATVDDIIPLSHPVTDLNGVVHHSIHIKAGQHVILPIAHLNTWKRIWGEDAQEFKPDRWLSPPQASDSIPGVWSNQMTFLGGPRACIGYRFSLVEMKALLFTLVKAFDFELAVSPDDVMKKALVVQRPLLKSNPAAGNILPMLIKPIQPPC